MGSLRSWVALVALVVLLPAAARADEDVVGTFRLGGREGTKALAGTVVVRAQGEGLVLTGPLGSRGPVELAGTADGDGWRFASAAGSSGGVVGVLSGAPPSEAPTFCLRLARTTKAGRFTGAVVTADGRTRMTVELTRVRRALVAYASGYGAEHDNAFKTYAGQARTYYRALGFEVVFLEVPQWPALVAALRQAGDDGATFSRVVSVSHGGWDGPMFSGQLSPWSGGERWAELARAFRHGTAPEARYYVSACHAGGSDRWEKVQGGTREHDVWVDRLARESGRCVAGPCGRTSSTFALRQVRALEGAGTVEQETRVASAEGAKFVKPGAPIAYARRVPWSEVDAAAAASP